jgi:hypothetical protein
MDGFEATASEPLFFNAASFQGIPYFCLSGFYENVKKRFGVPNGLSTALKPAT